MNIYVITNKITERKYVGKTADVATRWKQHIKDSKNKTLKNGYYWKLK